MIAQHRHENEETLTRERGNLSQERTASDSACRGEGKEKPDKPRPDDGKEHLSRIELYPNRTPFRRKKDRYTPYIVLRYAYEDGGVRPIPGGTPFWHSPDVWVQSSAGFNIPVAGQANQMFARVNNWGMQDGGWVNLRFWWANPSLAITEVNAHLIGTASAFVPAGYSVVVPCPDPWVPVSENNGHECILAEAWVPQFDPLLAPLEPVTDRHVCQKNLHVIGATVGEEFSFSVQMANISPMTQRLTVHIQPLSFREVRARLISPGIKYPNRLVATEGTLPLKLELAGESLFFPEPSTTYTKRLLAALEQNKAGLLNRQCEPMGGLQQTTTFKAWEGRNLLIRGKVPSNSKIGQAYGLDISQWIGSVNTGGYTLYIVVTADH